MTRSIPETEPSLLETLDFRAFFETFRLRWWVIPVVVAVCVGFLQAQDSDLRTEPATYVISRSYEVGDPRKPLFDIGIAVGAIAEFPEPSAQIMVLGSNPVKEEIEERLGKDIPVQIPINWETPFTFTCNQPSIPDCELAIDAYLEKAGEIRRDSMLAGIENYRDFLTNLQNTSPDKLIPPKIAALNSLIGNLNVPFRLIDRSEQAVGPTMKDVRRPTYLMGIAAGVLLGILILLQLAVSDNRIRSVRQLIKVTGHELFLGQVSSKLHEVSDRRAAMGLRHELNSVQASKVRFIPVRDSVADEIVINRLAELAGATPIFSCAFAQLSVAEMIKKADDEVDVLVVHGSHDRHSDVRDAMVALSRSSRHLAGVLLVN